jgi:hypothetical protein
MTKVRSRLGWSLAVLGAFVACRDELISDPSFDVWCGEALCSPWEATGDVSRVTTWHKKDFGIALGDGAVLSQRSASTKGWRARDRARARAPRVDRERCIGVHGRRPLCRACQLPAGPNSAGGSGRIRRQWRVVPAAARSGTALWKRRHFAGGVRAHGNDPGHGMRRARGSADRPRTCETRWRERARDEQRLHGGCTGAGPSAVMGAVAISQRCFIVRTAASGGGALRAELLTPERAPP